MVSDRHVWFPQLLEDFLFDSLILILAGTTQQQLFMCLFCTVVCASIHKWRGSKQFDPLLNQKMHQKDEFRPMNSMMFRRWLLQKVVFLTKGQPGLPVFQKQQSAGFYFHHAYDHLGELPAIKNILYCKLYMYTFAYGFWFLGLIGFTAHRTIKLIVVIAINAFLQCWLHIHIFIYI